jgi:hypothetical protein
VYFSPLSTRVQKLAYFIAYALYDDFKNNYVDANIRLGLAFFLTLGITGVVFLVAFIKSFRLRRKL